MAAIENAGLHVHVERFSQLSFKIQLMILSRQMNAIFFAEIFSATSVMRQRVDVAYCIHALSKRLSKTESWIVTSLISSCSSPLNYHSSSFVTNRDFPWNFISASMPGIKNQKFRCTCRYWFLEQEVHV